MAATLVQDVRLGMYGLLALVVSGIVAYILGLQNGLFRWPTLLGANKTSCQHYSVPPFLGDNTQCQHLPSDLVAAVLGPNSSPMPTFRTV